MRQDKIIQGYGLIFEKVKHNAISNNIRLQFYSKKQSQTRYTPIKLNT
jgi:hypothetical protein